MIRVLIFVFLTVLFLNGPGTAADNPSSIRSWKTTEVNGVHWLVTPQGRRFYSKGINIVDPGKESLQSRRREAYCWTNFFPSLDAWRRTVSEQLLSWGFNTRGGWSDPSSGLNLALTVDLELGRKSKFHWFDPFDPAMEAKTAAMAKELTAPYRNHPQLIGYYSDNEVGWWNAPLFTWFLGQSWDNHTKRVLWQLIFDHYNGQWTALLKDWVPQGSLTGFEGLKHAEARLKLRPEGAGIHLINRFMYLYTRHYYRLMAQAIRKAHPEALILGDRLPLYYHQDAVLAIGDSVDVISTNYNVDVPDGWVAPYYFDGLNRLTGKPVLVTEFFFAAEENRSGNRNETARSDHPKPGHLMTVQTQQERAQGVENALLNFAGFPNVVGAHWFQYCDEPLGGREDGEDYNMGLIDTANRPYEKVTDVFCRINPILEQYHQQSSSRYAALKSLDTEARKNNDGPPAPQRLSVPRAARPIDVVDQSLLDWDKAKTRIPDLKTTEPYVPFGDVHISWTPEGIYLASLSNIYLDPNLLEYQGKFPLSEAFQLRFTTEVEGKVRHFVIYLLPQNDPTFPDGFNIQVELYQYADGKPALPLPVEEHVQRIPKSLPHVVLEAFFPVEWLGLTSLTPGMPVRMDLEVTSFFREMTMTWSGIATLQRAAE